MMIAFVFRREYFCKGKFIKTTKNKTLIPFKHCFTAINDVETVGATLPEHGEIRQVERFVHNKIKYLP